MNREPTESTGGEVLVCGDCGRVNPILKGLTRATAVRCSGCGVLLCGDRQRKVSIQCPGCDVRLEIDANWMGQKVTCGNCQKDFVAERPRDRAIPAAPKGVDDIVPDGSVSGVGVVEVLDEEESLLPGARVKVRRTRKRKRGRERSIKEIARGIAATLLTFGLVIGVIVEVGRRSQWWLVPPAAPDPDQPVETKTTEIKPADLTPDENKNLDETLGRFFQAVTPEDALAVCRFQGEVGERMRAIASSIPNRPVRPVEMRVTSKHPVGERLFLRLTGKSADEPGKSISVVLERPSPGKFLIDWDSHVRFASQPWTTFNLNRDGSVGRFQLVLRRFFAGNVAYPIEEWTSFLVFWADESDGVHLFVRTDSPECEMLLAASEPELKVPAVEELRGTSGHYPVTLEVFFPPEKNQPGMPPAIELKKFCHPGWVDLREGE